MRNILLVAALASLTACSASQPTEAPTEKPNTPDEQMVGSYQYTGPDGKKMSSVLEANHTYTDASAGIVSDAGTWELKDGKTCFTSSAAGSAPECYTMSGSSEDGTLTATPDKGAPLKLTKLG
ncbi:MAG: hypothetical protein P0Y56_01125 [Candidatus Andeanibacterium colombiense]|uniref:Uncharacterized protein n=1 Tax=Candidatus Andeanibacterium colombiense TaxID=3121345 RepID=A0AAJ5X5L9_9SPHN|nr:MAG: hypothetical protein P0Y56_01125 [Sphingomonadaceae bacterium]